MPNSSFNWHHCICPLIWWLPLGKMPKSSFKRPLMSRVIPPWVRAMPPDMIPKSSRPLVRMRVMPRGKMPYSSFNWHHCIFHLLWCFFRPRGKMPNSSFNWHHCICHFIWCCLWLNWNYRPWNRPWSRNDISSWGISLNFDQKFMNFILQEKCL